GTFSHPVDFRLFSAPEGCRNITVTRAVGTWTHPDGSTLESEEDLRGENIVIQPGEVRIWSKTLTFDLAMQQALLRRFGGNEVRIVISYEFMGVDDVGGEYSTMIASDLELVVRQSAFDATASSSSGFPLNFSPGVRSHPVSFTFTNHSAGTINVNGNVATWYKPDGTFDVVPDNTVPILAVPGGQSRTWDTNFPVDSSMQVFLLRLGGGEEVQTRTNYAFVATDESRTLVDAVAEPDIVYNVRRRAGEQLVVFGIPGDVSYYPGVTSHTITYNLDLYPSAPAPVTLQTVRVTYRNQDGTLYRGPDSTTLNPAINLPVGGMTTSEAQLTVSDQ
ncbi:MAG: hypothetical protein AAB393_19135, partial [Bacteroidota bacterium]